MSSVSVDVGDHGSVSESVRIGHGGSRLSPSLAIVEAIADLAGVDPVDLADERGIVLYDYVEPDALDALVTANSGTDVEISVTVAGYDVRIDETEVVARRTVS